MEQTYYLISDAAKRVQVESHVLRYWEEELQLPIKRNELGHRFYTEEDINRFINIKNLKEKGLQLKAIKLVLQDEEEFGKEPVENRTKNVKNEEKDDTKEAKEGKKIISVITKTSLEPDNKADKVMRMQLLLRQMIAEAVRDNNDELCENLRDSIVKELDYQFRTMEEREEERESVRNRKEEEHFQQIDTMLRSRFKPKKEKKKRSENRSEKCSEKRSIFRMEK